MLKLKEGVAYDQIHNGFIFDGYSYKYWIPYCGMITRKKYMNIDIDTKEITLKVEIKNKYHTYHNSIKYISGLILKGYVESDIYSDEELKKKVRKYIGIIY